MCYKFEATVNLGVVVSAIICGIIIALKLDGSINWNWWVVISPVFLAPLLFKGIVPGFGMIDATIEVEYEKSDL